MTAHHQYKFVRAIYKLCVAPIVIAPEEYVFLLCLVWRLIIDNVLLAIHNTLQIQEYRGYIILQEP